MLTVGITGGIGSGKSTVCKVFRILGVPVFQADLEARRLQNEDPEVKQRLSALFGSSIYDAGGQLNRKKLAEIIFSDKNKLDQANAVIHPAVHRVFDRWKSQFTGCSYVLYEAAILFETGSYHDFDFIIMVATDEKERIERVMKRDQVSHDAIMQRIRNQMDDAKKIELSDFVIENNDNQMIIPKILELDNLLKSKNNVR